MSEKYTLAVDRESVDEFQTAVEEEYESVEIVNELPLATFQVTGSESTLQDLAGEEFVTGWSSAKGEFRLGG